MDKLDPKTDGQSQDLTKDNIERLKELFPEVFTEGRIDFEVLREVLGGEVDDRPERYGLNWNGKRLARRIAQEPSSGTLRPDKEASVNWEGTGNIFIEGDNLEVLKLLQKSYHRKVKMIYIDPPYNTGKEFIYPDRFQDNLKEYLSISSQTDENDFKLSTNTETHGRYHTNWLNMILPRLKLSRGLLRDDGVILCSIDYHEFHNIRHVLDEIYGSENFVGTIVWKGATDNNPTQIAMEHEYIVVYARSKTSLPTTWKNRTPDAKLAIIKEYNRLAQKFGDDTNSIQVGIRAFIKLNSESLSPLTHYNRVDDSGVYTGSRKVHNPKPGGYKYDITHPTTGEIVVAPANGYRYPELRMTDMIASGKILFGDDHLQIVQVKEYLDDYRGKLSSVIHLDSRGGANDLAQLFDGERKVFTNPKPVSLLKEIFEFCLNDGEVGMDFFAGSGTTADAIMQLNIQDGGRRRFVLVQLPEKTSKPEYRTIADITRARIKAAGQRYNGHDLDTSPDDNQRHLLDTGFRAFKLDTTNIKAWDTQPDDLEQSLLDSINNIKDDRSDDDVLYEILLKFGLDLALPIEERQIHDVPVYVIGAGALVICLAKGVNLKVIEGIAQLKKELNPEIMRVVFQDRCFKSDVVKTNAVQILRRAGVEDIKSL